MSKQTTKRKIIKQQHVKQALLPKVILTRPKGYNEQLLALCRHHDIPAVELDYITLKDSDETDWTLAKQRLAEAQNYDYLLWTSPVAVRFSIEHFNIDKARHCVAIGVSTAKALATHTALPIIHGEAPYTSETLLAILPEVLSGSRWLIITGTDGREMLASELMQRGAIVDYAYVYQRQKQSFLLAQEEFVYPFIWVVTSQFVLKSLATDFNQLTTRKNDYLLVSSVNLKRLAIEELHYAADKILLADSAVESDLWQCLLAHWQSKHHFLSAEQLDRAADHHETKNEIKPVIPSYLTKEIAMSDLSSNSITTVEEHVVAETEKVGRPATGKGLSVLAIAVALAGVGVGAFAVYQQQLQTQTVNKWQAQLELLDQQQLKYQQDLKAMTESVQNSVQAKTDPVLIRNIEQLQSQYTTLTKQRPDYQALETTLSSLKSQIDAVAEEAARHTNELKQNMQLVSVIQQNTKQTDASLNEVMVSVKEELLKQQAAYQDIERLTAQLANATDLQALGLAEVHYLLRMADHKLKFNHDITDAILALGTAKERLLEINDKAFLQTQTYIDNTLAALNKVYQPDYNVLLGKLVDIAELMKAAPLASGKAVEALKDNYAAQTQNSSSQEDSWYAPIVSATNKLLVIERKRVEAPAVMAPEERFFLQQNIQLQLAVARNALLQRLPDAYLGALKQTKAWIDQHYDPANPSVAEAIALLNQLINQPLANELPSIQPALQAFEASLKLRGE